MSLITRLQGSASYAAGVMVCIALLALPVNVGAESPQHSLDSQLSAEAVLIKSKIAGFRSIAQRGWLQKFYQQRNYAPVWDNDNGDVEIVIAHLSEADREGLDPADYRLTEIEQASGVERELLLTDALLRYTSDLQNGVHSPRAVDRSWFINKPASDIVATLQFAVNSNSLERTLSQLSPQNPIYQNLRDELQRHRELATHGGWPPFPLSGPSKFEAGDHHAQIEQLRERLAVTDGAITAEDPLVYDDALVEAVKRFQRRHGLNDDGVVGSRTRRALAVPVEDRVTQIIMAMERWRWLPRDLGSTHVIVNVPAYRLWFHQPGHKSLTMRTIVGTYKNQTPSFTQKMKYLVVNPNWYVPNKIAAEELAPKVNSDPGYVNRAGFKIYDKATNEQVDASMVDWSQVGTGSDFPYKFVQSSSDRNALGTIKFMFPNRYGIYLHDTSTRHLFHKDARAFSHGCVRIEKPMDLASRILGYESPETVSSMISNSSKNRHISLDEQIPVYIVYMTAWADEGEAFFYDDIYRRDTGLLSVLAK